MDVQEELDGVLCWIAALFILLLQWLYPRVPWSHVLSRMFYGHLTLSHDLAYLSPYSASVFTLLYAWGFLDWVFRMCGTSFPTWGSHNTVSPPAVLNWLQSPLKPRAWLYIEVASDWYDHQPRVDLYESKSEQGLRQTVLKKWISSSGIRT